MAFVLDASIALAWHFDDESDAFAEAVGRRSAFERVIVPSHWHAEVANGLLVGERRRRTTAEQILAFSTRLAALDLEIEPLSESALFERVLPLARAHRLTVYDAIYLEVAGRRGLGLATLDGALETAARSAGVSTMARLGSE